jgi:hypothetical protein
MEAVLPYVLAIVPTIGVGALFYFVIKSILEGDRRERLAQARWEAQEAQQAPQAQHSQVAKQSSQKQESEKQDPPARR